MGSVRFVFKSTVRIKLGINRHSSGIKRLLDVLFSTI